MSATIWYDLRRAAWSKICEVTINSSAPVWVTNADICRATVSGDPTAEHDSTC